MPFGVVWPGCWFWSRDYVLEASITTSVIIMWWSIKMNEFIQPKYPGNVSEYTCFEYLLFIHKTSGRCNINIWTSSLFWIFSYQSLPLTVLDQIWKTGLTCKIKLGPRPTAGYNKISYNCDNKMRLWLTKKFCKWNDFARNPNFVRFPWTARTKRSHGRYFCW